MSDPHGAAGIPPEIPGTQGDPGLHAPSPAPPHQLHQLPDFGPSQPPEHLQHPKPMNAVGGFAMVGWIVLAAIVVIGFVLVFSQVIGGGSDPDPFGGGFDDGSGGTTCEFDHEPSDAELEACFAE